MLPIALSATHLAYSNFLFLDLLILSSFAAYSNDRPALISCGSQENITSSQELFALPPAQVFMQFMPPIYDLFSDPLIKFMQQPRVTIAAINPPPQSDTALAESLTPSPVSLQQAPQESPQAGSANQEEYIFPWGHVPVRDVEYLLIGVAIGTLGYFVVNYIFRH